VAPGHGVAQAMSGHAPPAPSPPAPAPPTPPIPPAPDAAVEVPVVVVAEVDPSGPPSTTTPEPHPAAPTMAARSQIVFALRMRPAYARCGTQGTRNQGARGNRSRGVAYEPDGRQGRPLPFATGHA